MLVSSSVHAIEPFSLISGTLSIISSIYTLSKEDTKPIIPNKEDEVPIGYHYENIVDDSCKCIKKSLVANLTKDYPF